MSYSPIDPKYLTPGMTGAATTWRTMCANQRDLYADHGPPIAASSTYAFTASTSFVTVAEWLLCRNVDNQPVKTWILWKAGTGATATAEVEVWDDSSHDSATITTTSTSYAWASISVTPSSSSGSPRVVRLKLKTTADTAYVLSISSHVDPGTVNGIQASGFAPTPVEITVSNAPISSERYARLADGPVYTDADRPRCLYSVIDDFTADNIRATMTTSSTVGVTVNRGWLSTHTPPKCVRVSAYLGKDGSAIAQASIEVAGSVALLTGNGWQHADLPIYGQGHAVRVTLVNTGGSGNVYVRSVIITRGLEP